MERLDARSNKHEDEQSDLQSRLKIGKIRVSIGSAMTLGLIEGWIKTPLSTLYMLTYREGKCLSNCSFCSQARSSTSRADKLSRVTWPIFNFREVMEKIGSLKKYQIQRICLQSLCYDDFFDDISNIIIEIKKTTGLPLSLSCQPVLEDHLKRLKILGVDTICIPLDAGTKEVFTKVKGSDVRSQYKWEDHLSKLENAIQIFDKRNVTTHFIIGLGENDKKVFSIIQYLTDIGVNTSLFAFTPIPGTNLQNYSPPSMRRYRIFQLANYLINREFIRINSINFNSSGLIKKIRISKWEMKNIVERGFPFKTYGCEGCNRPYYNEKVKGPLFNYPYNLKTNQIREILSSINKFIDVQS